MIDPRMKVYVGGTWRPDFPDSNFQAEPPTSGKDPTSLTLVLSDSDINLADTITLTATLKTGGTALASKSVIFEEKVGTAAWATVDTETTNGSGVAVTSPALAPSSSRQYRARFATDASYVGSTSSVKTITVRTIQNVTQRFYAGWSQVYNENDSQNSETDIRQNMSGSSSILKRKSLVGFNNAAIQAFLADRISNVSIKISIKDLNDIFSIALIGYHNYNSKPTTWADANVDQNLFTLYMYGGGRYSYIDTTSANIDDWATGTYNGVSFGPATSTSTNYSISAVGNKSGDDSSEPWIEFTVTKWA